MCIRSPQLAQSGIGEAQCCCSTAEEQLDCLCRHLSLLVTL